MVVKLLCVMLARIITQLPGADGEIKILTGFNKTINHLLKLLRGLWHDGIVVSKKKVSDQFQDYFDLDRESSYVEEAASRDK